MGTEGITAQEVINTLKLSPHPEGGYYRETYRADSKLFNNKNEPRNISTAIYYLLENEDKSLFHRISSDELWFFHLGQPIEIVLIKEGSLATIILGNELQKNEFLQARIPANTWFAARIKNKKGFSLVSCTVSPGFDFADFQLAKRKDLIQRFPHLKTEIEEFTT